LLGGVLHALHLPGTGLFVGGASVLCISLLAHFCPSSKAILKATILVILIKGILSPHTPPGAYLAVFIQGSLGYLLFQSKKYFKVSRLLLGILTQLQSALQRLVVMLVVFGADLYQVAHGFVNYILKKAGFAEGEYVLYIVIAYLSLHFLMGVIVGWLAGSLPEALRQKHDFSKEVLNISVTVDGVTIDKQKRKRGKKFFRSIIGIASLLIFASLYFGILPDNKAYTLLIRAALIIVVWVWVISPFFKKLLSRLSLSTRTVLAQELKQVLELMPYIKSLVIACWASLASHSLLKKLFLFPKKFIVYLLDS